ncbi:nucleotidyltransferase [Ensifer sp. ENS05]|uniref:nucleotidyltransferase domain-containing protein n=1 Tax=Ensifer sp. ENS05 TaxID=2769277 RepID=UPI00177C38F7|nr:nucleotidyltransferase [Ensifer sp. ENS05]MBD9596932.1 nucleotidyltransferase [Ensifer sp. ENS05]
MNIHLNTIEAFLEALVRELEVPDHRYEQAEKSYSSLGEWLHRPESTVRLYDPQVYCQGSFRLGTAIRPHTEAEEYDVDSIVELRLLSKRTKTQEELKAMLGDEIKAYHKARAMVKPVREGNRCWVLDYADGAQFHMDVVPAVPNPDQQRSLLVARMLDTRWASTAISITDRREPNYRELSENWPRSNPKGYSDWFASRQSVVFERRKREILESMRKQSVQASVEDLPDFKVKTPLQSAIMILKRHRDNMFATQLVLRPISIIITTLAAHSYENQDTISGALFAILDRMDQFIVHDGRKYIIANPTDPFENFADKWEKEPQKAEAFFGWLRRARADFYAAAQAGKFQEMANALNPGMGYALSMRAIDRLTGGSRLLRAATGASATAAGTTGAPSFANADRRPTKPQGYA